MLGRVASAYLLYSKAFSLRYVLSPAIIGIDDVGRIGGGAVVSDLGFIGVGPDRPRAALPAPRT